MDAILLAERKRTQALIDQMVEILNVLNNRLYALEADEEGRDNDIYTSELIKVLKDANS